MAFDQKPKNLIFALRQAIELNLRFIYNSGFFDDFGQFFEASKQYVFQCVEAKGFFDEVDCSEFHCANRNGYVAVGRQHDNRPLDSAIAQCLQHLHSIEGWHPQIEEYGCGLENSQLIEKIFGGSKWPSGDVRCREREMKRTPNISVVVNHVNMALWEDWGMAKGRAASRRQS